MTIIFKEDEIKQQGKRRRDGQREEKDADQGVQEVQARQHQAYHF